MRLLTAFLFVLLNAATAAAQSTYVGGSVVAEIARFSKIEGEDDLADVLNEDSFDGEALGFAIVAGRRLGNRWGVALEFAQSAEMTRERSQQISRLLPGLPIPIPIPVPPQFPPTFEIEVESSQQHTTVAALVWVQQDVGDRVELAYLGGVSFNRSKHERDFQLRGLPVQFPVIPESEITEHGAGPAVGFDATFKFGEHAAAVGGVRLHGLSVGSRGGWLVRPAAGLRWRF